MACIAVAAASGHSITQTWRALGASEWALTREVWFGTIRLACKAAFILAAFSAATIGFWRPEVTAMLFVMAAAIAPSAWIYLGALRLLAADH